MENTRRIVFALCIGFIIGFFLGGSIASGNDDLLTFETYIIEIRYGLISAAIFGLLAFIIGKDDDVDVEEIGEKLVQIENKLDMFFLETECSNCQNTLQYPSNFAGQMQCRKCSFIMSINQ